MNLRLSDSLNESNGHKLEFYPWNIVSRILYRSILNFLITDFLIVDIADSNQLPSRKPWSSTSGISLPACCPIYTNIIFRTKLSSSMSANKLNSFLERQLHHDCSQVQLFNLFLNNYIIQTEIITFSDRNIIRGSFSTAYKILPNLFYDLTLHRIIDVRLVSLFPSSRTHTYQ